MLADIAVIGGGSVGVSFLAQLVSCLRQQERVVGKPITVLLFEPRSRPGAGNAYDEDLPTNLLNIPVRNMSAYADDKAHFQRWLEAQPRSARAHFDVGDFDSNSFLPRPLFGRYMENVYQEAVREGKASGIVIRHVEQRAIGAEKTENGAWRVLCGDGDCYITSRVVLCNGNLASTTFPALEGHSHYFNDPYPVRKLAEHIEPDATVGIIGSSLSAVDAIVALKEAGHRGMVTCFSRNGRLPSVRSAQNRTTLSSKLTSKDVWNLAEANGGVLTLEHFFSLLASHVETLGGRLDMADVLGPNLPAREALDHEIEVSQRQERLWQVVCSASNDVIDLVWQLLSEEERRTYHQTWRSLWMARRATFPLQNALKLQRYFRQGTLNVSSGFNGCRYDETSRTFHIQLNGPAVAQAQLPMPDSLQVDYVVNATSFSLDPSSTQDDLVSQLLRSGYASSDPFGGVRLDYATGCLMDVNGEVQSSISLLGSLAVGTYFWTLSMDVNARLAHAQAQRIGTQLGQKAKAFGHIENFDMVSSK
ncbi:FAD/NAD(P)-binding protein [Pollutimonas bauzanensis]|uniref:FAD/NAD(P)-binding protein n=1 Tax=Pollutimonas bauzanensis TaxID=658167 RepID=UPI00334151A7